MIRQQGDKWVLMSQDGAKVLGEHDTEADALAQEHAVEAAKHSDTGGRTVQRVDRSDVLRSPEVTNEGYLRCEGKAARTGIQIYHRADGSEVREYRPPGEVFKQAYLDAFAGLPLTNRHPGDLLRSESAAGRAVGAVAGARKLDDTWVGATISVWDKKAQKDIRSGRSQLSVGYVCELYDEPGVIDGQPYDCVQRNIKPNHLALCDAARAGSEAAIRLDEAGNARFWSPDEVGLHSKANDTESNQERRMATKVKLDGFEFEASDANTPAIIEQHIEKRCDALREQHKKELSELRADEAKKFADKQAELQKKLDSAEDKAKELQAKLDAQPELIKAQAALREAARRHLGENFEKSGGPETWPGEIVAKAFKKDGVAVDDPKVVETLYPSAVAKLDAELKRQPGGSVPTTDAASARERMLQRNREAFVK